MYWLRGWLLFVMSVALMVMAGCGAKPSASPSPTSPTPTTTPQVTPANLNGNWLLAGVLPAGVGSIGAPQPFGFALTLTTQGVNVVGAGNITYECNGVQSGLSFGGLMKGTVAADGTFTATLAQSQSAAPQFSVNVSGEVPEAAGQPLHGQYTLQLGPSSERDTCIFSQTDTFTATALSAVSGTYVGTGTVGSGNAATTLKLTVQLKQGVSVVTADGAAIDALGLSGSVKVEGSPCFSGGTILPAAVQPNRLGADTARIAGNDLSALFTLDDGSRLLLGGDFADAQNTRLFPAFGTVSGGKCGSPTPAGIRITELDRVPPPM